jgi:hypothetical protein
MSIEAMKQALEAYCKTLNPLWNTGISRTEAEGFFEAGFKASVAEAEKQEPVAWMQENQPELYVKEEKDEKRGYVIPLYPTPPQRTWVGLTDEEIADCAEKMEASDPTDSFWREFFRGIEAKLKEKNT